MPQRELKPGATDYSLVYTIAWLLSTALLVFGLTQPVVEISVNVEGVLRDALDRQPVLGLLLQEKGLNISEISSRLPPSSQSQQSVVSSAVKLYRLECYTAATLILLFSIVVPVCKQLALLAMIMIPQGKLSQVAAVTTAVHKWAMLDVFVLAMVVLVLASASAWTATLLDGFYWFLGYFFTAGLLGVALSRRIN